MNKQLLFKILKKTLQIGSLVSSGAGAFLLFSGGERAVKVWTALNYAGEKIVKSSNTKGEWTFFKKYPDSSFYIICHGDKTKTFPENLNGCERHIESKADRGHPIYVHPNKPTKIPGFDIYKFTFTGDVEDGRKEYWGHCFPLNLDSKSENPCKDENLPSGWTKTKED